jgi:ubiquitin-conjugating enzyme E2 O
VRKKEGSSEFGMIAVRLSPPTFTICAYALQRCWHDVEDMPPLPDDPDPLNRPLKHGELGVSWLDSGLREILPEKALQLVDRTFSAGDFCKRSVDDVQSGVVSSIEVKGRLVHAISQAPIEGWKTMADLEGATEVFLGDYVSCDDWIGQVRLSARICVSRLD